MDSIIIYRTLTKVLLLVLFISQIGCYNPGSPDNESMMSVEASHMGGGLLPVEPTEYRIYLVGNNKEGHGRRLAPFQLCLLCKCCASGGNPSTCATMPCCFGIDCQLPDKPFGVCAFVPKTCNCTSCAT